MIIDSRFMLNRLLFVSEGTHLPVALRSLMARSD